MNLKHIIVDSTVRKDENYPRLAKKLEKKYSIIEYNTSKLENLEENQQIGEDNKDNSKHQQNSETQMIKQLLEEGKIKKDEVLVLSGNPVVANYCSTSGLSTIGVEYKMSSWPNVRMIVMDLNVVNVDFLLKEWQRYHKLPWIMFETQRLIIREMTEADMKPLKDIYETKGVGQYLEPLYSDEDEIQYAIKYRMYVYEYYGFGVWIMEDRFSHEVIGRIGLEPISYMGEPALEMGYVVKEARQKQGLAWEAGQEIMRFARKLEEYSKVFALINENNYKSISFIEKMGFCLLDKETIKERTILRYVNDVKL